MTGRPSASVLLAATLAALAGVWAVASVASALRVRPDDGRVETRAAEPLPIAAPPLPAPDSLVRRAVAAYPFTRGREPSASRAASAVSFFTGESAAATQPLLRLLGTVVDLEGGSFAMCQLGDAPARAVRVGDRIGEYRLRVVRQGSADFAGPDGAITLRVPNPAP